MALLLFTCPNTNQKAPTGIETDVQSLRASWNVALKVNCSHCGGVHELSVRETYINGADDAADQLSRGLANDRRTCLSLSLRARHEPRFGRAAPPPRARMMATGRRLRHGGIPWPDA
jgi:hypothetical protein